MVARSRSPRPALLGALALAVVLGLSGAAAAHPLAPALLELHELDGGRVAVAWTQAMIGGDARPVLPADCRREGPAAIERRDAAWRVTWTADCGERGLDGKEIGVAGLEAGSGTALVRLVGAGGGRRQWLLTPAAAAVVVAAAAPESGAGVALRFLALGAEHLVRGADHLAFVAGLFLLVRRRRALLAAVTAFTVGHSATLALAVLGHFPVPPAVVELGIAASILFLAVELVRAPAAGSLLARRPWLAAGAFGLLHGAGFAAALAEVGLPPAHLALALVSFNAGIELAQIAVLLLLGGLRWALPADRPRWLARLPAEAIGVLGGMWLVERALALL